MLFNLDFVDSATLLYFFLFFLIIELFFLIHPAIGQILNPIAELATPIGIPTKEAKSEMETHPVIVEIIINK